MNLICLRCMDKGGVSLTLGGSPRFVCSECKEEYGASEARATLAELQGGWEKVLTWVESYPKSDDRPPG